MLIEALKTLYVNDLIKLRSEIEQYSVEEKMWHFEQRIANSGGNLCLHLIGNLNAYIGVGLARTDYVRKRDLEFSLKNIPRRELLDSIDRTIPVVEKGLSAVSAPDLDTDFPIIIWDNKPAKMDYTLVRLATHLNYHLGQVNYHRRLLDK